MKQVIIKETNNGYLVTFEGYASKSGEYVFRGLDILHMLTDIGTELNGKKTVAEEK